MVARLKSALFWVGVPLVLAAILFWPQHTVLYVTDFPFTLEINPIRSGLPSPLAELWFFYPATLLALAILAVAVARRGSVRLSTARARSFFLPTYLAGFESLDLIAWSMRCHSIIDPPDIRQVLTDGMVLSGTALALAIVAGCVAARRMGPRISLRSQVPGAIAATVASVGLIWWFLWVLVRPA